MIDLVKKYVPFAVVAVVAALAVNLTNDCGCGKNRGNWQGNSHQARGRGSAGDTGNMQRMQRLREGMKNRREEGKKKKTGNDQEE